VARFPSDGGAGFLIGGFAQKMFEHQSKNTAQNKNLTCVRFLFCLLEKRGIRKPERCAAAIPAAAPRGGVATERTEASESCDQIPLSAKKNQHKSADFLFAFLRKISYYLGIKFIILHKKHEGCYIIADL
jgi:hypothetical protein